MEEGWLVTVSLCYFLGGLISTAAPMLAVSIVAGAIPGQMTNAGMYAAVVTTTNAIATELVTAYAAKKVAGANEDKFGPVKKAAAAAVANTFGSAVTIMAGAGTGGHQVAITGIVVVLFIPLGYTAAKLNGRAAAAGALRVLCVGVIALCIDYVAILFYPRILEKK